jgi:PTS system mannose-specific IID component/fructoselysine and glucoselysine-specific PTS system IID component
MVVSFFPSFLVTYFGGKIGYSVGNKYLTKLYSEGLMERVMYICSVVGLMVIGSMMASMIGITTPVQFGEKLVLQKILDGIVPQIIPLSITFLLYWLLKKKVSTGWMLTLCIVGGIILSALGIFR